VKEHQLLVGLSGNPGGAIIAFLLLLFPIISRLEGRARGLMPARGRLTASIVRQGGLRGFFWGRYKEHEGENTQESRLYVTPFENHFCGALETHKTSNCLVEVPAGKVNLTPGSDVVFWRLPLPPLADLDNN
jgi:molybdopterin biosynthesis enzyme